MDIIIAITTLLVIVTVLSIMAYKHNREIKKQEDEINKKQDL
jgi:cell division protein FtsL